MARDLKLNIDGDSGSGQRALEAAAAAAALAAHEADKLGKQFKQAERDASALDRQLLATTVATRTLARELAKNPSDTGLKKQLADTKRAAAELKSIRADVIGGTEQAAKDAAKAADAAAKEFGKATANAAKDAEKLASKAAKEFDDLVKKVTQSAPTLGEMFSGGPTGFLASPPGAVIGGATAVVGTAAAGGALAAGVGAGVAGAGIAGAALGDPQAFSAAWGDVTSKLKSEFIDATRVFDGPGLDAINSIGDAIGHWDFKGLFAAAAPYVKPLVTGTEEMAGYIFDGVKTLTQDAGPAVDVLAKDLPMIGQSIDEALTHIGEESQGGADGLHALDTALADVIAGIGYVVAGAEAVTGGIHDASDATRNFFDSIPGWVQVVLPPLALYKKLFDSATEGSDEGASHFGAAMQGVTVGLDGAIGRTDDFGVVGGHTFIGLDQQVRDVAATVERMNQAFDKSISDVLALSNANVGAAQAFADLSDQFRKGAGDLDIATQKGRDNQQLINTTIEALQRQRDAAIDAGNGSKEATDAANAAYNGQLTKLQQIIDKAHGGKSAVDAFIDSFRNKDFYITQHVRIVQTGPVSQEGVVTGGVPRVPGTAFAHGGIRHAAAGMIVPPRNPGSILLGEPQTGGEALIPLGSSISDSGAMALAGVVGAHHGFDVGRSARIPPNLFSGGGGAAGQRLELVVSGSGGAGLEAILAVWLAKASRTGDVQIHSQAII
jgi:hypothetical protein